jgi:1-acyl-sn-glycerol-3-phosphate acyltransferase
MGLLGPLIDHYTHFTVGGDEIFDGVKPPVIFAANHSSHLDTPCIMRALPKDWRKRTATIAAADYFYKNRIVASLVTLSFATVPIERAGGGLSRLTTERLSKLVADGWNMLIYPEGTRSRSGKIGRLKAGVGFIATEHRIPIVPICVQGTYDAMPVGRGWPKKAPVRINFGQAIYPAPGENHRDITARLQSALEMMQAQLPPARFPPRY